MFPITRLYHSADSPQAFSAQLSAVSFWMKRKRHEESLRGPKKRSISIATEETESNIRAAQRAGSTQIAPAAVCVR